MNIVIDTIKREIGSQSSRFVFPSEAAASLWAQKICGFINIRSVARGRFMAWDRFKEEAVRVEVRDTEPVSAVIRKLFAEDIVTRNAAEGLFKVLIPREFAQDGAVFAGQIASLLPSLKNLRNRQEEARETGKDSYHPDDEDGDFEVLEKEYTVFLNRHGLFEPSWGRPPLRDREHHYHIFFPEAIEDFSEYERILGASPTIHFIRAETGGLPPPLFRYPSSRAEIRAAVLEIRRLREEENIPYEDMAVSVPGLEDMEPYLLREFALYHIPVHRRSGRPLAEQGAGRLFQLIQGWTSKNFSFAALKALLLNQHIPWRYPGLNRNLIEFGIRNNCVSGYREENRMVDVWEEALYKYARDTPLYRYYQALNKALNSIGSSRNFSELRRRYFAFRGSPWEPGAETHSGEETYPHTFRSFLSRDNCTAEEDAVLARCIEELSALIRLEEDYRDLALPSAFSFYIAVLQDLRYVPQQPGGGVNIFPYRVAAAAPFTCHFVLNAAQNAATVLYQPLAFLRQDKRKRLRFTDTDASAVFFRLYHPEQHERYRPCTRISASEETFSGWTIPHSVFAGNTLSPASPDFPQTPPDPFIAEGLWWAGRENGGADDGTAGGGPAPEFPARLFPVQLEGFTRWQTTLEAAKSRRFDLLKQPFPDGGYIHRIIQKKIAEKQYASPGDSGTSGETEEPRIKVSATDLNNFFKCPVYWFFRKICGLEEFSLEAKLLDEANLGILYHNILRDLFERIKAEDRRFDPGKLDVYRSWVGEYTREEAARFTPFQGAIVKPLLSSQLAAIAGKLRNLLKIEAAYFSGYEVKDLERDITVLQEGVLLNGRIDRVSVSPEPDSKPVIIDYKSGSTPSRQESIDAEGAPLGDFQIPMYIKLYEEACMQEKNNAVGGAFFMSINYHDITAVVGSPGRKRGASREEYQSTIDALETYINQFRLSVETLNFTPREIKLKDCFSCEYKNICRTPFSLNAGTPRGYAHVR